VTELGLVVGIDVIGLMLALLMWRQVTVREAGAAPIRRLASAIERAGRAFLWQEFRLVAISSLVLLVAAALLAGYGAQPGALTRLETVFWSTAGLAAGVAGACATAYIGTILAVRGSAKTAAAAGSSVDGALSTAMRAAGAAALVGETLSVLGIAALFGLAFAVKGGFAAATEQALPLAAQVALLLPGFAVGATATSLVLQRGGGAFHAASGVGADQAGERDAGLEHDDPRNPAVVAELVGDHVGASATRSVDGFATASAANAAALIIGATLASHVATADPLALLALPLVLRAFGTIASAFGILLVRTDEVSSVPHALLRGYLSTAFIALTGLAGSTFWLLGEHFLPVCAAGALGLLAALGAAQALALRLGRRSGAIRDAVDSLRVGGGAVLAAGLGAGIETALLPVSVLAVASFASARIGSLSGVPGGPELCLLVCASSALCVGPYALAVATLGSISDGARGIASMSNAEADLKRRSARVDDAGFGATAIARQYSIFAGAISSLLVAWALARGVHGAPSPAAPSLALALPWCGALGSVLVLSYAGSVARATVRGAREVCAEVERQLRGFPREHGIAQIPPDYTPSYKSCVDLTTLVALRRALGPIGLSLLVPVALGVALRVLYRSLAPELVTQGLTWFVVVASLTGLGAALSVDATRATLGTVRRAHRVRDTGTAFTTSINADALSDIFGNAAAPALQLLVKAIAVTALIVAPFLS